MNTVTQTHIQVRYAETDQMGIAHHSCYAVWFEQARTEMIREAGIRVTSPPMYRRETLSGTAIRARMVAGEAWEECVPCEVADVIREIRGIERMQQIAKTD